MKRARFIGSLGWLAVSGSHENHQAEYYPWQAPLENSQRRLRPPTAPLKGYAQCPCLTEKSQVGSASLSNQQELLGPLVNASIYGIGCRDHDKTSRFCANPTCNSRGNCDKTWCEKYWCYVDPEECSLSHRRSRLFPEEHRYISYATCFETDTQRLYTELSGTTIRVGVNSNTGGWRGSYRTPNAQFQGPLDAWSGPLIQFIGEAAKRANFTIELAEQPTFLINKSMEYFLSSSSFDLCVYASTLGLMDICVAQYFITEKRGTSSNFIVLGSLEQYLLLKSTPKVETIHRFVTDFQRLFSPFDTSVWVFLIFLMLPLMGILMLVHEYGQVESAYQKYESVTITDCVKHSTKVEERFIPYHRHIIKSVYVTVLSVMQKKYKNTLVSAGGKLHLIGISFMMLTVTAVYTAKLAAILTNKARLQQPITSLANAMEYNYTFCASRKTMQSATLVQKNLKEYMFVVDPIELGGDGLPGFDCPNCAARQRSIDFIDPDKAATGDARYCHAAIASKEDLAALQGKSMHCDKTLVGDVVVDILWGISVHEKVSDEFLSLFLELDNDQVLESIWHEVKPESQCEVKQISTGVAVSLTIQDLTGIWIIGLGFACIGVVAKVIKHFKGAKKKVRSMVQYDQAGHKRFSMRDLLDENDRLARYEATHENIIHTVDVTARLSDKLGVAMNTIKLQRMIQSHSSYDSDDDMGGSSGRALTCLPVPEGDEDENSDSDNESVNMPQFQSSLNANSRMSKIKLARNRRREFSKNRYLSSPTLTDSKSHDSSTKLPAMLDIVSTVPANPFEHEARVAATLLLKSRTLIVPLKGESPSASGPWHKKCFPVVSGNTDNHSNGHEEETGLIFEEILEDEPTLVTNQVLIVPLNGKPPEALVRNVATNIDVEQLSRDMSILEQEIIEDSGDRVLRLDNDNGVTDDTIMSIGNEELLSNRSHHSLHRIIRQARIRRRVSQRQLHE